MSDESSANSCKISSVSPIFKDGGWQVPQDENTTETSPSHALSAR